MWPTRAEVLQGTRSEALLSCCLCTSLVDWISGDRQGPTSRLLNEQSIREQQQQQHYGNIIQFSRLTRCWHTRWFRNSENRTHNTASRLKHDAYVCVRQHCWINTPCWVSRLQNMHGEGGRTHYMRTQTTALPPRGRHYTGMAIFRWGVVVTHFRRKKTHGTHTKTVGIRRRQYGGCGTRQTR